MRVRLNWNTTLKRMHLCLPHRRYRRMKESWKIKHSPELKILSQIHPPGLSWNPALSQSTQAIQLTMLQSVDTTISNIYQVCIIHWGVEDSTTIRQDDWQPGKVSSLMYYPFSVCWSSHKGWLYPFNHSVWNTPPIMTAETQQLIRLLLLQRLWSHVLIPEWCQNFIKHQ